MYKEVGGSWSLYGEKFASSILSMIFDYHTKKYISNGLTNVAYLGIKQQ